MKSRSAKKSRGKSTTAQRTSKNKQPKNLKKVKCDNNSCDKQTKLKQQLFEKQQVCSLASTKQKFEYQQSYSQENSKQNSERQKSNKVIFTCICAKTFVMRKRFQNHLKAAHSYHLMSPMYCEIRDKCEKDNIQLLDHYEEHRSTINLILLSIDGNYSIPEEILKLYSEKLIQKSKKKLKTSQIDLTDFGQYSEIKAKPLKSQILSLQFLNSLKQLVIDYISIYERRTNIYLKNAPLSHLLHIFLINLFNISNKIDKMLTNKNIFFQFEKTLKSFQNFVNQKYQDCFQKAQVFYNHINIRNCQAYSDIQRTWKIDILIKAYLEQLCRKKPSFNCFQLSKFLLCAFQEFVISNDLEV